MITTRELENAGKRKVMAQLQRGKPTLDTLRALACKTWTSESAEMTGALCQSLTIILTHEKAGTRLNFTSKFGRALFKNGAEGATAAINRILEERDVVGLAGALSEIAGALDALRPHLDIEAWTRCIGERVKERKRVKITRDANLEASEIEETVYTYDHA